MVSNLLSCLTVHTFRFLVPVILCLVLMMMVWFGLADIQTKLAGFGLADSLPEGEEENLAATNRCSRI